MFPFRGSDSGPPSGRRRLKKPHCNKHVLLYCNDETDDDGNLIEAVGDGGKDEDSPQSSENPDPPGYPRLPRLARDHSSCHHMGLTKIKINKSFKKHFVSNLECEMSLIHQEGEFGHAGDEF